VLFEDSVINIPERDSANALSVSERTDSGIEPIAFSPGWWSMAAMQVALDPKVSDKAFRVFVVIGGFKPKNSNIVNVGQRRIAKLMQKPQWYVSTRVKELRQSGWLGTRQVANGKRTVYVLLSEAYSTKAANAEGIAGVEIEGGVKCSKCRVIRKAIPACGVCRKCLREMEEERMLTAAREKLGPQATLEQLALECHIQRITPRIRKILRRIERAA
jgi:DNA-binding MarR family transcriptional regulator